jgi:uncharacterized repeat protein (TIGR03803 family)
MSKFNWGMRACGVLLVCATAAVALPAQTMVIVPREPAFTTLYSFCTKTNCTDGVDPFAGLVQGTDGKFYGITEGGGAYGFGTVFKINPDGTLTTLHSFCSLINNGSCVDGSLAFATLVQGTDGSFYGATWSGGTNNWGTVFSITTGGMLTTLHKFDEADGAAPFAGLIQATNGNFYGTTQAGGANCTPTYGCGTIFTITPDGTLTTLYSFCSQSNCADGNQPEAVLVHGTNGDLYGTTFEGGTNDNGTVFKIAPSGKLTTLHKFCSENACGDGARPQGGLIHGTDGNFYGTTEGGGANNDGTVFKISPGGILTTLHSFHGTDGRYPFATLVQDNDGNFYGTTLQGGSDNTTDCLDVGCGTIFRITLNGTLTTLHRFEGKDGSNPKAGLVQGTNGEFYGTTSGGGTNGSGTVFSLSVGMK